MATRKKPSTEIVVPQSEPDWEDPPPPGAGHAGAISLLPWGTYDRFLQGYSVAELAISDQTAESHILADIEQMRTEMRRFAPMLLDHECDNVRRLDLIVRDSIDLEEENAQSLRVRADAQERRALIIDRAASRPNY